MAEKTKNDAVKEITDKLEQGLKELFDSEKFKAYLNTMSKFHNYSFNNTLLIAMQKPDATLVAGFQSWQKNFGRHVNKGEKGIKIMAPAPYKKKQEMEVIDKKTGRPVLDDDGKPKTVDKDNYELVYSGKLEEGTSLEDLYTKFNIDHPEDFRGHSMSVSDVVVIKDADGERAHFVDSVGFTEVPEFLADKTVDMEKSGSSMDSQVADNSQEADRPARALDEGSVSQPGESAVITEDSPFRENPQTENPQTVNNEPVTFIVAECSEFHSLGECHEGIATAEEAAEIFESIPADRLNGVKSIGISVPNADDEYPVELDVLVGHTFDLELIEYVPQIKENSQAMEMIAELMDRMPEMEVRGEIPAEIQEHLDQIHEAKSLAEELSPSMQLASEIDQFMYDYDTYAYHDQVPDREAQVAELAADLDNGEADYMKKYLSEIVEHQEGAPEDIEGAKKLIEKIDDFKPLAKIEEQLEENYNHIDNTLNNLKKPSEERAETAVDTDNKQEEALDQADSDSGRKTDEEKQKKRASKRPSLKKRLEEKKEQVAAQPVKPAPEKEKVKSNGRGLNDE